MADTGGGGCAAACARGACARERAGRGRCLPLRVGRRLRRELYLSRHHRRVLGRLIGARAFPRLHQRAPYRDRPGDDQRRRLQLHRERAGRWRLARRDGRRPGRPARREPRNGRWRGRRGADPGATPEQRRRRVRLPAGGRSADPAGLALLPRLRAGGPLARLVRRGVGRGRPRAHHRPAARRREDRVRVQPRGRRADPPATAPFPDDRGGEPLASKLDHRCTAGTGAAGVAGVRSRPRPRGGYAHAERARPDGGGRVSACARRSATRGRSVPTRARCATTCPRTRPSPPPTRSWTATTCPVSGHRGADRSGST